MLTTALVIVGLALIAGAFAGVFFYCRPSPPPARRRSAWRCEP